MLRFALFLTLVPAIAFATEGWRPCEGITSPLSVNISDCDKAPCDLKRGTNVLMESRFIVEEYSEVLRTRAHFNDLTTEVTGEYPLPSSQKETCTNLIGARCPLYDDEEVTYTLSMPILSIYPTGIDLDLTITVENANNRTLTCFSVLARTVK